MAIALGFASAVVLWCTWLLCHMPAIKLPISQSGPILLVVQAVVLVLGCWAVPRAHRITVGALAGLVGGSINLLLLGSKLGKATGEAVGSAAPGASGLEASAGLIAGGFLLGSVLIGTFSGVIARFSKPTAPGEVAHSRAAWLGMFAWIAAIATFPLLLLGGWVTSTNAGLTVPDWPGTFGANMFLYPLSIMDRDPRVFSEHTHRLFGSLIGLTTLTMLVLVLWAEPRRWVKAWTAAAFVAVCVQGVMGAGWVVGKTVALAIAHGILGQIFFASMVALAVVLSPQFIKSVRASIGGGGGRLMAALLACLSLHLIFGAMYRHLRLDYWLYSHIGLSLIVMALCIAAGVVMIRRGKALAAQSVVPNSPAPLAPALLAPPPAPWLVGRLKKLGMGLHIIVSAQFVLGWVAWAVIAGSPTSGRVLPTDKDLATTPMIPVIEATFRTLHQANGAILLAVAAASAVWIWRLTVAKNQPASALQ